MGTLFKKALDEIHGQTLQILGFFKRLPGISGEIVPIFAIEG